MPRGKMGRTAVSEEVAHEISNQQEVTTLNDLLVYPRRHKPQESQQINTQKKAVPKIKVAETAMPVSKPSLVQPKTTQPHPNPIPLHPP